jgi:cystathionine beta-synthase
MPEKMSKEKSIVMEELGAQIIRTPDAAAFYDKGSNFYKAQLIKQNLNRKKPGSAHILDQYTNPYNPLAHYDATGEEICAQLDNKVDMVVIATGTGGSICGIARKIKEKCPDCKVIGVDPIGSVLSGDVTEEDKHHFFEVEGVGYDFEPTVLDRKKVDVFFKSEDKQSFLMARKLIRREGILCGGSAGTATHYAIKAIERYDMKEGKNVVVLIADSIRNYM